MQNSKKKMPDYDKDRAEYQLVSRNASLLRKVAGQDQQDRTLMLMISSFIGVTSQRTEDITYE